MLIIDNTGISITRGDSADILVRLNTQGGAEYQMQAGDKLRLTVRPHSAVNQGNAILEVESDTNTITLTGNDTSQPVARYSCDIKLIKANGQIETVYPRISPTLRGYEHNYGNFTIMPSIN